MAQGQYWLNTDKNDLLTLVQIVILIQTSLLAALGGLNTAAINPAYGLLAKDFGISKVRASYQT
jgi:hypothetical protein